MVGALTLHVDLATVDTAGNTLISTAKRPSAILIETLPEPGLPTREEILQELDYKTSAAISELVLPPVELIEVIDAAFFETFGFTYDFAKWLVLNIYLDERPEDRELLRRWQAKDIGVEYRYLQIHNPEATEEELLELLRESIRAGEVHIN